MAGPVAGRSDGFSTHRPEPAVLPPRPCAWLGLVAVCAALVVVVLGVLYAGHSGPGAVDRWFVAPTDDSVKPPWRAVALVVDFLAEPAGSALVMAAVVAGLLWLRRPRAAVSAVVAAGLTVVVATLVKSLVGRTIHGPDNLSYPSGHTAFLTAVALVVTLTLVRRTALALLVALAAGSVMGWAQVALSAHYPTDVLAGWCTALAVAPVAAWGVDRVADRVATRRAGRPADTGEPARR
ncbi:phosphatase PAP2 family protein [Streptomyces sp. NPDC016845]|uniref:phosphatase PAP2 family protein n=1 Tax=Streptomyces sp. NPDC016845 TaxID=3364972 RepID=UPI0037A5735C